MPSFEVRIDYRGTVKYVISAENAEAAYNKATRRLMQSGKRVWEESITEITITLTDNNTVLTFGWISGR